MPREEYLFVRLFSFRDQLSARTIRYRIRHAMSPIGDSTNPSGAALIS